MLARAAAAGPSNERDLALSALDLAGGRLDQARTRLDAVLARDPGNFAALAARGCVEREFQDSVAAARFFERALAIPEDPNVRAALAALPKM